MAHRMVPSRAQATLREELAAAMQAETAGKGVRATQDQEPGPGLYIGGGKSPTGQPPRGAPQQTKGGEGEEGGRQVRERREGMTSSASIDSEKPHLPARNKALL